MKQEKDKKIKKLPDMENSTGSLRLMGLQRWRCACLWRLRQESYGQQAVFAIRVTPTTNALSFQYFFASNEYNQPPQYNDTFALWVVQDFDGANEVSLQGCFLWEPFFLYHIYRLSRTIWDRTC